MKGTSFHKVFALLAPELRPRIPLLAAILFLAALTAFGDKAPLLLLEPLFDRVLFPETASGAEAGPAEGVVPSLTAPARELQRGATEWIFGPRGVELDAPGKMAALWRVAAVIAAATVLTALAQYAFTLLSRWVSLRMVIDLRMRLARHLMGLSLRYHGQRRFGDLLSRISSDVTTTLGVVNLTLKDLTQQPLMILGALGLAAVAAPKATLFVLLLLPLVAVPVSLLGRRVRRRSRKSLSSLGASVEALTQMFTGIRTVKAFRGEERELARYREKNEGYLRASMRMVRAVATIQGATALLSHLGFAALLVIVGWFSIHHGWFETAGSMLLFFTGISYVYSHTKRVTNAVNHVQESAGAAERLQALLREPVDIVERPGAVEVDGLGTGIAFEDVTFSYPDGERPAIERLSIHLRPGETLALVGPSGAGKTTFVDLIARFIEPASGRITAAGIDLGDITLDSWSRQFALVGQVPFLFHASIGENIRYGRPDATPAEIEAAARAANIHDFAASLSQGYDTIVGDQGARLSGGQRQRITIARAILKGAPLLLLDEATSALDSESEKAVQEALERLMEGRTVIVIAHRLSTIRNADRIAVLDRGRLVELGSHAELLARRGVYARLHAVQFPAGSEVSV